MRLLSRCLQASLSTVAALRPPPDKGVRGQLFTGRASLFAQRLIANESEPMAKGRVCQTQRLAGKKCEIVDKSRTHVFKIDKAP